MQSQVPVEQYEIELTIVATEKVIENIKLKIESNPSYDNYVAYLQMDILLKYYISFLRV